MNQTLYANNVISSCFKLIWMMYRNFFPLSQNEADIQGYMPACAGDVTVTGSRAVVSSFRPYSQQQSQAELRCLSWSFILLWHQITNNQSEKRRWTCVSVTTANWNDPSQIQGLSVWRDLECEFLVLARVSHKIGDMELILSLLLALSWWMMNTLQVLIENKDVCM